MFRLSGTCFAVTLGLTSAFGDLQVCLGRLDPCRERLHQPFQLCQLSEHVVARPASHRARFCLVLVVPLIIPNIGRRSQSDQLVELIGRNGSRAPLDHKIMVGQHHP